jgi:dienelactone hydrolase
MVAFHLVALSFAAPALAEAPLDLWTPEVLQAIRDRSTLNLQVVPRSGYADVFFDSEVGTAKWGDSEAPYEVHTGGTIRIHGYLAVPFGAGPSPALVIGHGHGGHGDPDVARALALLGYVALSIDGPSAGLSTGGPQDTDQAWLSVEEVQNQPSPEVGYLYHYAYAGMRALTALEALADEPSNPLRIDPSRLGVIGASMGGQFTYYINGVDDRVKAAVAIAVAGDFGNIMQYEGSWLYHRLYYYTRDGLRSGTDALNAVASCDDPTLRTFDSYFDPMQYAPTQHAPVLTILGTHDQYFVMPAINSLYDRVQSAGTSDRFGKRLFLAANGKHGVVDGPEGLKVILPLLGTTVRWLKFAFDGAPEPPQTPAVTMRVAGSWMIFRVKAVPGASPILAAGLHVASRLDSTPDLACDFAPVQLFRLGSEFYGFVPIGQAMPCGPPVAPDNVLYFASVSDWLGASVSSKMYHRSSELAFGSGFVPVIEHWHGDDFPVQPSPDCSGAVLP